MKTNLTGRMPAFKLKVFHTLAYPFQLWKWPKPTQSSKSRPRFQTATARHKRCFDATTGLCDASTDLFKGQWAADLPFRTFHPPHPSQAGESKLTDAGFTPKNTQQSPNHPSEQRCGDHTPRQLTSRFCYFRTTSDAVRDPVQPFTFATTILDWSLTNLIS